MAKLTKAQKQIIAQALYHAERANAYVQDPTIAIARKADNGTTTLHYIRPDGATLFPVDKEIGSDLCGLGDSIRILRRFLDANA